MHAHRFNRWGLLGALAAAGLLAGACNGAQDGNGPYPYRNRAGGYTHHRPRYSSGDPRYNVTAQQSPGSVDPVIPQPATTTAMEQGTGGSGEGNLPAVSMRRDPTGGTGAAGTTASDPATWRPRETSPEFVLQAPDGSFKQNNHTGGPAPLLGAPALPVPAPQPGNSPQALQRQSGNTGPERLPSGIGGSGATGPTQPETGAGGSGVRQEDNQTGGSMAEPAKSGGQAQPKEGSTGNTRVHDPDKPGVKDDSK
ncbi:hypothetical protein FGE12_05600 [Aggregicoccus sp. 17bor-14]|uniref:hypothetical protein n=1 Tax=Myxococcaceae TaxID=31 RepID=UPI00129D144E|nr:MULTISPECIES: hypothetical protein [Myxococcaceae]MBF5041857.1 hypothetical protein [Simulacricoccus sp. 17bor-14]MRI87638.1 hypothetical protein [Aggregicoccus sp. 17bor-14]